MTTPRETSEMNERCAKIEGVLFTERYQLPWGYKPVIERQNPLTYYELPTNYERLIALAQKKDGEAYAKALWLIVTTDSESGWRENLMPRSDIVQIANATPAQRLEAAVITLEGSR